ncbi:MAG: hypothetical protein JWO85_2131 [Candidatus Eremiobacteraeota bacterium]|nr:hypothetical protein [Candidatus Eremiobacteraeota bacterium]
MKQSAIVAGRSYTRGGTWADRKYEGEWDMETGEKPELISETLLPMFRFVLDVFHGASGEWVAYQLPWGRIRVGRLSGFARWAKSEYQP